MSVSRLQTHFIIPNSSAYKGRRKQSWYKLTVVTPLVCRRLAPAVSNEGPEICASVCVCLIVCVLETRKWRWPPRVGLLHHNKNKTTSIE
jgi:hypothetical protein